MEILQIKNPYKENSVLTYLAECVINVCYFDYQEDTPEAMEVIAVDEEENSYRVTFTENSHSVQAI